jgi:hypothetical protein
MSTERRPLAVAGAALVAAWAAAVYAAYVIGYLR